MTKKGQTHDMTAHDLVKEISHYSGRVPDIVLQHQGEFSQEVLQKYEGRGEHPIEDDLHDTPYQIIREPLTHDSESIQDNGDTLVRSLIRHDATKLGRVLYELI